MLVGVHEKHDRMLIKSTQVKDTIEDAGLRRRRMGRKRMGRKDAGTQGRAGNATSSAQVSIRPQGKNINTTSILTTRPMQYNSQTTITSHHIPSPHAYSSL